MSRGFSIYVNLYAYRFLVGKELSVNPIVLTEKPKSAVHISQLFKCDLSAVIKTLLFIGDSDKTALVSVRGDHQVEISKLMACTGIEGLKVATAKQVLQYTRLAIGGITPFLDPSTEPMINHYILDSAVTALNGKITIGSGKSEVGLQLDIKDLLKVWPGQVGEIHKSVEKVSEDEKKMKP